MAKIRCPECRRILGDTNKSVDCNINCHWCKQAVHTKVVMARTTDYFRKDEDDQNVY